jgi:hypothetical protein
MHHSYHLEMKELVLVLVVRIRFSDGLFVKGAMWDLGRR